VANFGAAHKIETANLASRTFDVVFANWSLFGQDERTDSDFGLAGIERGKICGLRCVVGAALDEFSGVGNSGGLYASVSAVVESAAFVTELFAVLVGGALRREHRNGFWGRAGSGSVADRIRAESSAVDAFTAKLIPRTLVAKSTRLSGNVDQRSGHGTILLALVSDVVAIG